MADRFRDKVIVIVGATGGLGSTFAQAFADEGAKLILAGRNTKILNALTAKLQPNAQAYPIDVTAPASVSALRDFTIATFGKIDVLVNVTGVDVRKPFDKHSPADFRRTLDVNLMGAILLTHTFLPVLRESSAGMIVHIGGFADGRLAFPYYSVNIATRAGLFSFIESVNRELKIEGSQVIVSYFSPSPADTEAERPFHPIWREMGLKITPKEKVAADLLAAIGKRKRVYIMGGWETGLFARLNAIWPRLADVLLLNRYGSILKRFLAPKIEPITQSSTQNPVVRYGGIVLIVLSFVLYGLLLLMPFTPISTQSKVVLSPVLIGLGEASFWIGGLLLGKQVIARHKRYFDPCYWLCLQK